MKSSRQKALIIIVLIMGATLISGGIYFYQTRNSNRIILATTTSTYDSGLLDYLLPKFEEENNIKVSVLSVGTGQALAIGESGDVDVILVHSREREDEFVENGYGVHRSCVMYNDFVLIGPQSDPANIYHQPLSIAMERLKSAGKAGNITFFSRGDNSGTNSKELDLWSSIGFLPNSSTMGWYKELGSGMGDTLMVTNENLGYTLIDRGTWLARKDTISLQILVEGDQILLNPYGVIQINPDLHPSVKADLVIKFIGFLVSEEGQKIIEDFRINGETLFYPDFGFCDELVNCTTTSEEIAFWTTYNGNYTGS